MFSLLFRRRDIFRFHDGRRWRRADPVEVWTRMEAELGPDWGRVLDLVAAAVLPPPHGVDADSVAAGYQSAREAAAVQLADAVCRAFDVRDLDRGGLTRTERVVLAARFFAYMGGLVERTRPFGKSPPPAAGYLQASTIATA